MTSVSIFVILQCLVSGYAVWRGGAPERWVAILLLVAMTATLAVPYSTATGYRSVYWAVVWVDLALLAALIAVALLADRYWPLWLAAIQAVAVAAHGVKGYDHAIFNIAYWLVTGKTAYLILLVLLFGTLRHQQRLALGLPEYPWTYRRRHARRDHAVPGVDREGR